MFYRNNTRNWTCTKFGRSN